MSIPENQYILINNINDCENYGKIIAFGKSFKLKFYTSYLKFHFFSILKLYNPNILIIDLNINNHSNEDVENIYGVVYDNTNGVIFDKLDKNITYIF